MHFEAGGAAGAAGGFGRRQGRVPDIGVEAPAVDVVGLARDDIEERRHHFFGLDEPRGPAVSAHCAHLLGHSGVLAPAPGLTMLIVSPVPSVSLAQTSVAISSAAFEAP